MRATLPPLAAIKAFEAAARRSSFTKAADELGMTQAAVSYQIKIIEERVGAPLFLRRGRGVVLTDTGMQFSRVASEALDLLRDAFATAKGKSAETLSVSIIPTFATNILAQRLGRFQIDNPDLAVRVDINQSLVDFAEQDVDLAVRSGKGDWPGLKCDLLFPAIFTPMLSPALADTIGGVREPDDLLKLPIVEPSDPWWQRWFEVAGVSTDKLKEKSGLRFGSQILEANAAIAGQGISILTPVFYRDAIAQKQLIQPFDLTCDNGESYWLVYPENRRNTPKIRAFRDWLLAEVAALE